MAAAASSRVAYDRDILIDVKMADSSLLLRGESVSTLPPQDCYSDSEYSSEDSLPTSLSWIVNHILECRFSNELPLRIMFTFNAGQRLPTLKQAYRWWHYEKEGKKIIEFLSSLDKISPSIDDTPISELRKPPEGPDEDFNADHCPFDRFMDAGNDCLLDIDFDKPNSPGGRRSSQGLPPDFVQKLLLTQIFQSDYKDVDFTQALTGLDYLRDLECTRKCALREAAERLEITEDNWRTALGADAEALKWVGQVQKTELEIEGYYAKIFVNLRIWTMVNELRQLDFYKPNVLALLNTLFPPSVQELPNDRINTQVLHKHRAALYRYVVAVESHGPRVLDSFIVRHLRPGTSYSWPETRLQLEKYIELADSMIKQSNTIHGVQYFRPYHHYFRISSGERSSFSDRPTTGSSTNTSFDSKASFSGIPRTPGGTTYDSSSVRARIYSRRKTNSGQTANFERPETPNFSEPLPVLTPNLRERASTLTRFPIQFNPTPSTNSFTGRHRTVSKSSTPLATSPLAEQLSDVEAFMRPTTPLTEHRIPSLGIKHGLTRSSGRPSASHSDNSSGDSGRPWIQRAESPALTYKFEKSGLPSDNLEFLQRPYESAPPLPIPKKKTSMGDLFLRKKASATSSNEKASLNMQNPLGITLSPSKTLLQLEPFPSYSAENLPFGGPPLNRQSSFPHMEKKASVGSFSATGAGPQLRKQKSYANLERSRTYESKPFEPFPGYNKAAGGDRPQLKKQRSFGFLESTRSRNVTNHTISRSSPLITSPYPSAPSPNFGLNKTIKKKSSMPTFDFLSSKSNSRPSTPEPLYFETNDPHERVIIATPRKRVHAEKSESSLKSNQSIGSITAKSYLPTPRKLFKKWTNDDDDVVITSADISEPFPVGLQKSFTDNTPNIPAPFTPQIYEASDEFRSKEYTRKWFLEESRARRFDLNKPAGGPMKTEAEIRKLRNHQRMKRFWRKGKGEPNEVEEIPRATPKELEQPFRFRMDSIFQMKFPPRDERKLGYKPIDVSKFEKY